ncbi:EAP30/Vps36 family-domain-containing protein [Cristinia sonorae]|uniref:Vacuolar protein-sorting-associated protein 36 n=1 Tax=Cristinia sonorae TaxID=1940300 RepID=A0A8K0UE49_9AGAR|nr:EAP30/Vps36 family-domain-containing protein [Cristinia sonorae]
MGCLKRYTKPVDGTIPIPALLYDDEDLLTSQEGLGIYDGTQKSLRHQSGTVHATTHRLFYIDNSHPGSRSFALDLSHISRTEHYAGLFTSSPKVTLHLHSIASAGPSSGTDAVGNLSPSEDAFGTWECEVCSHKNPPGLSPAASSVCSLCGVPRSSVKPPIAAPIPSKAKASITSSHHLSTSLPSSSANLLALGSSVPPSAGEVRGENGEVSCPACTFLNHPSIPACEICGTSLPRLRNSINGHLPAKSAPSSRPTSPFDNDDDDDDSDLGDEGIRMIRLSFRKGGDKAFYAVMRRGLLSKGWESKGRRDGTTASTPRPNPGGISQSGINGLLQTVNTTATAAKTNMNDALQDLEALMVKAKDMVHLAEELNERLTAINAASSSATSTAAASASSGPNPVEPEEATFIRSSLSQLGLQMANAPVTLDMIRDERKWVEELARELAGVLQSGNGGTGKRQGVWDAKLQKDGGMMGRRGIVGLDEIWGGWNRARGVALIPPSTFLQVLPVLPAYTSPPIHMRTFVNSGISVLHTPPYTKAAFASRMVSLITLSGPRTTVEVAHEERLPIGLVQDMVDEVEEAGEICRDGGSGGGGGGIGVDGTEVWWCVNAFREYVWDGQVY